VFLYAAATMGVDPQRCIVIEDSAHGVEAARAAGMRVLAYTGGVTPAARLAGPSTELFGDMRTLPALLGLTDGAGTGR
jgi:beta-phosphoglucomutase-like phosphatase (HAD superfamily)